MQRDGERVARIVLTLERSGLDAVVCSLPSNVLLLTGYWPVVGTAVAVASRAGLVGLVAPSDERDLAERGWADEVRYFESGSTDEIHSIAATIQPQLERLLRLLGIGGGRVGWESGAASQPCSYAEMHLYGAAISGLLQQAGAAALVGADELLAVLRSRLTADELQRIRIACALAERAFLAGARLVRPGHNETEVAAAFRQPLQSPSDTLGAARFDGFAFCMSGPNSGTAYGAYARSR